MSICPAGHTAYITGPGRSPRELYRACQAYRGSRGVHFILPGLLGGRSGSAGFQPESYSCAAALRQSVAARDDEYPKLARIFNLARRYRDILVNGLVLPEASYGEKAVSRGDEKTRLLTLRNLGWNPLTCRIKLDEEIGLTAKGNIELRSIILARG